MAEVMINAGLAGKNWRLWLVHEEGDEEPAGLLKKTVE
jgi:hypothetical protein